MGMTVHYRGNLKDLDRVEDFEDRILDLALELGGQAQHLADFLRHRSFARGPRRRFSTFAPARRRRAC